MSSIHKLLTPFTLALVLLRPFVPRPPAGVGGQEDDGQGHEDDEDDGQLHGDGHGPTEEDRGGRLDAPVADEQMQDGRE